MEFQLRRELTASPADAFRLWTDGSQLVRWVGGLRSHELLPGPERGVGSRFRQVLEIAGSPYTFEGTVLEEAPERLFAWRLEHPEAALLTRVEFLPRGEATDLVATTAAELRSMRLKFVKGLVERYLREQWEHNLDRFRGALAGSR